MTKERAPEQSGWALTYSFSIDNEARGAYEYIRDGVLENKGVSASVIHFVLRDVSYVVVFGEGPAHSFVEQVRTTMATRGQTADLPDRVTQELLRRVAELTRQGVSLLEWRGGSGERLDTGGSIHSIDREKEGSSRR